MLGLAGKSTCPACVKSWLKPGIVVLTLYPCTRKVGAGGSGFLGHACLCREFKGTLGYMRVYRKKNGRCQSFLWAPVRLAYLISCTVAIQCLETAFGVTLEDSDLALPQTLPEIFEAATASKVSLGFPRLCPQWQCAVLC